jgi:hypothetical protein
MTTSNQTPAPSAAAVSGLKKIDGMIKGVQKGYSSAENLVQETALAIIVHAKDFNDCSRAKTLVRSVPARERNLLVAWFGHFSPIGIQMGQNSQADKCRFMNPENRILKERGDRPIWDIDGAKLTPWTEDVTGQNPVEKPLNTLSDFWDVLDKMVKREIANAAKVGEDAKYNEEDRAKVIAQAEEVRRTLAKVRAVGIANDVIAEAGGDKLEAHPVVAMPVGVAA